MDDFVKRLRTAAANSINCPTLGKGLFTHIADGMKVTPEAVRKWFQGETLPRTKKMQQLSRILDCDYVWLSTGDSLDNQYDKKVFNLRQHSSVFAAASVLTQNGWAVASAEAPADILAVRSGSFTKYAVHTCRSAVGEYVLWFRKQLSQTDVTILAALQDSTCEFSYNFVQFKPAQTIDVSVDAGNHRHITIKNKNGYFYATNEKHELRLEQCC